METMLDFFRKAAKTWVIKILFSLLALSFVAWGIGDVIRGGLYGQAPALVVGDVSISAAEVNVAFQRELALFNGKMSSQEAIQLGLMDATIQNLVGTTLVNRAARDLGLTASKAAVHAEITNNQNFRGPKGEFDPRLVRFFRENQGLTEKAFLEIERQELIRGQVLSALGRSTPIPDTLADPLSRWREEQRVAEITLIEDASRPLPQEPEPAILEKYYTDNLAHYMAPEFRSLTVMLLQPQDIPDAEIAITADMLTEAYNAHLSDFTTPERRRVKQIELKTQDVADKAEALIREGKSLDDIGTALNLKLVDLGEVEPGDLVEDVSTVVFNLKPDTLEGPLETSLGWYLMTATVVRPSVVQPLAEVSNKLTTLLRHEKKLDLLSALRERVEDTLFGKNSVEETAKRYNLRLLTLPLMDEMGRKVDGTSVVETIPMAESLLPLAFKTEKGTESTLTSGNGNEGMFLVRVDDVAPPKPRPLSEVHNQALAGWQAIQRHELARVRAEEIVEQLKDGRAIAEIPATEAITTEPFSRTTTTEGLTPDLVGDLFKARPGGTVIKETPQGWVVARLVKTVPFLPEQNPELVKALRQEVAQDIGEGFLKGYLTALEQTIGVKVDRSQMRQSE